MPLIHPDFSRTARRVVAAVVVTMASVPAGAQDDGLSYYARGALKRLQEGAYEAAEAWCEKAEGFGVNDPNMTAVHLEAEMAQGKYEEAAETALAAAETFEGYVPIQVKVIEALKAGGREKEAAAVLKSLDALAKGLNPKTLNATELTALGKAALLLGAEPKMVLSQFFQKARKDDPENLDAHLAAAELAIEKADYALAAKVLGEARTKIGPLPEILSLLAKAYSPSDRSRAAELIAQVLETNPSHLPSLLLRAEHAFDAENYSGARATLDEIRETNPRHPMAWAYEAAIAELLDDAETGKSAREKALAPWPKNPEVDYLIGEKLSQNRRFAEGSEFLRRALEVDPAHRAAKKALGQNLLRLGKDAEGWKLIEEVQAADKYDVETYNLMLLHDHLATFEVLESERFTVRMTPEQAAVFGPRVVELLEEAAGTLGEKYGFEPDGRVVVDFFPNQQDFAIRTLGFPGGIGILGACFGNVIAMNSPGSAGAMGTNWESTLWHEFCHTITLGATNSRIPRWLTEGISVYEERQRDASCGHKMTPEARRKILHERESGDDGEAAGEEDDEGDSDWDGEGIIPIKHLSAALTAFNEPGMIDFAYYQASLLVEYMLEEFGEKSLRPVLDDLRENAKVEEVLEKHMAPIAELDGGFAVFAKGVAEAVAPDADWEKPDADSPLHRDPGGVARYLEEHPDNIWALSMHCRFLLAEKKWEEARETAEKLVALYPEFVGEGNGYAALARACRNLGEVDAERDALREWAKRDGDATAALERLIEIDLDEGNWPAVEDDARRLLAVNPLLRSPHRALGLAAQEQEKSEDAIRAFETLLHLDPVNPADTHFRLGQLYAEEETAAAKRHILLALEEAPRFRAAHRLLLELTPEPGDTPELPPAPGVPAPPEPNSATE